MEGSLNNLVRLMDASSKVVIFTGAGVSAESGIPTFRGRDGLWDRYDPADLATFEAFNRDPLTVWKWYLWRMRLIARSAPNNAHKAIASMERFFKDLWLVTQNVDNLHRAAGSIRIIELHGNIFDGMCRYCGAFYNREDFAERFRFADMDFLKGLDEELFRSMVLDGLTEIDLPRCSCGGIIGPGVVWFGENLPQDSLERAFHAAGGCDFLFSVGTSCVVYPAAHIPLVAKKSGAIVVEVNLEETPVSAYCDFVFRGPASRVMPAIASEISKVLF